MESRVDWVLEWIASIAGIASGLVVVLMMFMITLDAVGRKFGWPVPGALEFSEAMMVAAVYLALMAVQRHRENVFVSLATQHTSTRTQAVLDSFSSVLGLILFAIFTWIGFEKAWDATVAREYRIASILVPIWPFRWFIPLGLGLLCLQLLANAIQDWRASKPSREEYLPEI